MTPDQQRIAIAEACGWTGFNPDNIPDCLQYTACAPNGKWGMIPDYLNDLNAMHEAEKCFSNLQKGEYQRMLKSLTWKSDQPDFCSTHATAHHRAEAFLKTLNLWTP